MATLRRSHRILLIPAVLAFIVLVHFIISNQYQIKNALSYATRPLWDEADGPKNIIPHYYAEGMTMDQHACQLHGWKEREARVDVQVMDAVLMSSELDLLEIRMHELDSVVDKFFIIESNATFTGLPKETYFTTNRARFSKFEQKIVYHFLPGYPLQPGQTAWHVEASTRDAMTALLHKNIPSGNPTLVIMSDIDEIPSRHTVELLKTCDYVKMKGFSHSDRIGGNMKLLDPRRIQETICRGKDIFGMLPEAYSYKDLLSQMSLAPGIPYIELHLPVFIQTPTADGLGEWMNL
ncbi:hypothetical protein C0991_007251 [Blastosporella zonata]|nr:hypothetical protein C0991_007251 [Blastosporella zonata]